MRLTSPDFAPHGEIPRQYTCRGMNINPPLVIADAPIQAKSFVLIVEDTDATPHPWTHWLVFNIPASIKEITAGEIPQGAVEGLANGGTPGYEGPCPKYFKGIHYYLFTLYALNTVLDIPGNSDKSDVYTAMEEYVVDSAELVGICTAD